jgi:hypothetical protein
MHRFDVQPTMRGLRCPDLATGSPPGLVHSGCAFSNGDAAAGGGPRHRPSFGRLSGGLYTPSGAQILLALTQHQTLETGR